MFYIIFSAISAIGCFASAVGLGLTAWNHNASLVFVNAVALPINTIFLCFWISEYRRRK